MEVIIPPRDHGHTTYRYTWDQNGEVERVQRVNESVDYSSSRQTVEWPFQDRSRSDSQASTNYTAEYVRRQVWQPNLAAEPSPTETLERDLVPDYVINYLRGETPETLARKKALRLQRAAELLSREHGGLYSATVSSEHSRSLGSQSDLERMLQGDRRGPSAFRRLTTGWRGGMAMNSTLAFLILLLTIICLTVALAKAQMFGGEEKIFEGSCAQTSAMSFGLHIVINLVVVTLVAISNYAFQVLSSPTRQDVAAMHDLKRWVDIGIPSVRNLRAIGRGRAVLVGVILLAVLSTQVIYNAVIFTTRAGVPFDLVFVTENFLTGAPFSNATSNNEGMLSRIDILALQDQASRGELVNMTTTQCLATFGGAFETGFGAVVLVADAGSPSSSLLQTAAPGTSLAAFADGGSDIAVDGAAILYCLAQPGDQAAAEANCSVTLNGSLLGIVALLNLVTVIAVAAGLAVCPSQPLVTLGDAIAAFLADPDPSTRGSCLLTKADVWHHRWGFREAKYWASSTHFWLQSPSVPRWAVWALAWLAPAGLGGGALAVAIRAGAGSLSALGDAAPRAIYVFPAGTGGAAAAAVAALPQALLFVLYLATNALVSTYYLSHELSQFALPGTARGLRVSSSDPRGAQTSSLYLTVPRPVSWLLMLLFAALGFLLSQSVVPLSVDFSLVPSTTISASAPTSASAAPAAPAPLAGLGVSGAGLLAFLAVLVALAALVLGLGLRRADPSPTLLSGEPAGNPLVLKGGSCSAVLAARCHGVRADRSAPRRTLAWGVVAEGTGMIVGHATFSSRPVAILNVGRSYA